MARIITGVAMIVGLGIAAFLFPTAIPFIIGIAKPVIAAGSSLILGGISSALTKKGLPGGLMNNIAGREITVRQAAAPWRIVYGAMRGGAIITFAHVTGTSNEYLHLVLTLAKGKIQAINTMYFDGVEVPLDGSGDATGTYAGYVHVQKNLGDPAESTQGLTDLATACPTKWTANHLQRGHAKVYVRLQWNADLFPNGVPNITFDMQGRLVYDPRTSTTAYSNLVALCLADYLVDTQVGFKAVYADEVDNDLLIAAANICAEAVALKAGGTEDRYTLNGMFDTTEDPVDVLHQMAAAMGGYAVYIGGKFQIYAGAYRAATVTLTEADARGSLKVVSRLSKQEIFNGVKGTFFSADNDWQAADFQSVDGAAYLAEDGAERIWQDIQLPFTTSVATAQRLAKLLLERTRRQITVEYPAKLSAYRLQPPDVVQVTNARFGWSAKTFEVQDTRLAVDDEGALACDLVLRETDATAYSWVAADDEKDATAVGTVTLPDIKTVAAPTGLALTSGDAAATIGNDGLRVPRLKAAWTAPADQNVISGGSIIVQYKKNADATWIGIGTARGDATEFYIAPVTVGTAYDVRLYAVNSSGVVSAAITESNHTVTGPTSISPTASYRPTTNPLTAADVGGDVTVSIAAFTMRFPGADLSINSGSITALDFGTLYYIFYDDTNFNGGTVSYGAATTKETALDGSSRFFVGSIRTPADGGINSVGNNDGGTGAQEGKSNICRAINQTNTMGTPGTWVLQNDKTGAGAGNPVSTSAFTNALTNPSIIIVGVRRTSTTIGTPTDTAGNTYLDCGAGLVLYYSSSQSIQLFYALNTSTTAANIVSVANADGKSVNIEAFEWTGGALSSPIDGIPASNANANTGTGGGQNVTSGPMTPALNGDLIVGWCWRILGTLTKGTGFTAGSLVNLEYLTQTAASPISATWSDDTNNDSYGAIMAAFKVGGTGAATVADPANAVDWNSITYATLTAPGNGAVNSAQITLSGFTNPWWFQSGMSFKVKCDMEIPTNDVNGTGIVIKYEVSFNAGVNWTPFDWAVGETQVRLIMDTSTGWASKPSDVLVRLTVQTGVSQTTGSVVAKIYEAWIEVLT